MLLFNERTGNLEVSHRFLLHDAEHALSRVLKGAGDLNNDTSTQEQFFEYVQQNFQIESSSGQAIELRPVGYEVEGKHFWVYQETKIPDTTTLNLRHSALHELWPNQTNHINVEKDGWIKSVRLQKHDNKRGQSIDLSK